MILYNVTVNIEEGIHEDWIEWMKTVHIPAVLASGLFEGHRMYKLLTRQQDETGITYCIQYFLKDLESYKEYTTTYAPPLQKEYNDRYAGRFAIFRTILEEVE